MARLAVDRLDCSAFCRGILRTIGRPVNSDKSWLKIWLFMSMHVCCLVGNFKGLCTHWQDMGYRFTAIEDFFVLTYEIIMILEIYLSPKNATAIFNLVERTVYQEPGRLSTRQTLLVDQAKRKEGKRLVQFILMCCFFQLGKAFPQFIYGVYFMVNAQSEGQLVDQKQIPMPVLCWYPFDINDVYVYMLCAATQLVTSVASLLVGIYWFTSSQVSLIHLLKEIDILSTYILEIDDRIQTKPNSNQHDANYGANVSREYELQQFMSKLIIQHQQILRSVKEINGVMQLGMLAMNYFVVFVGCFNLYGIVIIKETAVKIKYSLTILTVCVAIFFNCWIGQQLINKCDELRLALLKCSWIDKPKQFKSDLQIMITNANRPLEIKPFRLYTLNYNNLTTVTKAAYSCFNVLLTIHIKSIKT